MRALTFVVLLCGACSNDSVASDEDARNAYLGLDAHIDKAIALGFAGFNAASSANIPPQMTTGTATGTLNVTGQVDQGASSNKTMNLVEAMVMYSDDAKHTYATDAAAPPALGMKLMMVPTGTLNGTLVGSYTMTGDLTGKVTLNVSFSGSLQAGAGSTVERKPGTTHITGTAVSDYGTYAVDVTR
jgi:hypothetical protein